MPVILSEARSRPAEAGTRPYTGSPGRSSMQSAIQRFTTGRGVDEKPRAFCVSIYPEMSAMVRDCAEELGVAVDIIEGGIHSNGHLIARDVQEQYDVIISQAGTALCIQDLVHIPVVSINLTTRDFIKGLEEALQFNMPLALISYTSEFLQELETIARVLTHGNVASYPYSSREDFDENIQRLSSLPEHVLVGFGGCMAKHVEDKGCPYVLIRSSREHVRQAVLTAKNIIDHNIREKRRARRLHNIVNYSREGIVSIDKHNLITICNLPAKRMLKLRGMHLLGANITHHTMPTSLRELYGDGSFTMNSLMKVEDKSFLVSRVPVTVRSERQETVMTFQEFSQLQKIEAKARAQVSMRGLVAKYNFNDIICCGPLMKETIRKARDYAATEASILITGETGTGKELFAQSLHRAGKRCDGPFVAINCAALPEQLLESELFGYEEGAFTGARKGGKAGLFEIAHKGTIFLDEVGEISLSTQSRLLRVLQEKELFRVGGDRIINVDARVITATNKNLYKLVMEGRFRRDLFFRLNVLTLPISPVRRRPEDIAPMVEHFLQKGCKRYGKKRIRLSGESVALLQSYSWPGNVRELEHIMERLLVLCRSGDSPDALLAGILDEHIAIQREYEQESGPPSGSITIPEGSMRDMEQNILKEMLVRHGGNRKRLAKELGISRVTVWKKLKELGLEEDSALGA